MSIWNKVLIGCIIVASLVFFVHGRRRPSDPPALAAVGRKIRKADRRGAATVAQTGARATATGWGWPRPISSRRNWRPTWGGSGTTVPRSGPMPRPGKSRCRSRCPCAAASPASPKPGFPHGIADKTILHVFEKNDVQKGGRYLGEFKVVGVTPTTWPSTYAQALGAQLQHLAQSKGPWVLFARLPLDSHERPCRFERQRTERTPSRSHGGRVHPRRPESRARRSGPP